MVAYTGSIAKRPTSTQFCKSVTSVLAQLLGHKHDWHHQRNRAYPKRAVAGKRSRKVRKHTRVEPYHHQQLLIHALPYVLT